MTNEIAYTHFKLQQVQGRYVTHDHIQDYLHQLDKPFFMETLGVSVQGNPIYGVTVGSGPKRILMWSQMHGNESTTTKAVLDMMNFLKLELGLSTRILQQCTLKIIPILNPDGALAYTRTNANEIDLNRDAQHLSQPESKLLKSVYEDFRPDFCFNLHDQRTIFNVGKTDKPATVSFLAPAFDVARNLSETRLQSMRLIAAMNKKLQVYLPGGIGRYDDSFNANCVGDAFQMLGTPTILFEAGHFSDDYEREVTRKYIFTALREALVTLAESTLENHTLDDYLAIPENQKLFCDIRIENADVLDTGLKPRAVRLAQFSEQLQEDGIRFVPKMIPEESARTILFAHHTKDAANPVDRLWLKKRGFFSLF